MKKIGKLLLISLSMFAFVVGCQKKNKPGDVKIDQQTSRPAWYTTYPGQDITGTGSKFSVSSEAIRLSFFGWSADNDHPFTLKFPENTSNYKSAIIKYRMGAWNQGCSAWDITTAIYVKDKASGEWYELTRAFTPYGNSFGASWERYYYFDVTEYLPLLSGDTEFKVAYLGFDATDTRAHTVTLTFDLYEGQPSRTPVYRAKVYDSNINGNSGYRGYAYGVKGADIEASERLGLRKFTIPAGVDEMELRVAISGHGHDQGRFVDRTSYMTKNAAEFDENFYTLKINGAALEKQGQIYINCNDNYAQAGTCYYARANWCPGNPLLTQYWELHNIPENRELTIDLDLEKFESSFDKPNAEGVAQYMVTVDLVGYKINE